MAKKAKKKSKPAEKESKYTQPTPEGQEPDAYVDRNSGKSATKRFKGPVYELKEPDGRKRQLAPSVEKGKSDYRPRKESLKTGDYKVAWGKEDPKTGRRKKFKIERIA